MVKALNESRLRVVMDVVYNHERVRPGGEVGLDRIPGYYHRLNAEGAVETSTCCQNTATEHAMMEKLMVDLVTWARDYKVDGFRFDLMGHHSKANMLAVRAALDELTLAHDGVDGKKVYLYGEGWNRRGGERRPLRAGDAGQHGRHRDRHVQRPPPRRSAAAAPSTATRASRASAAAPTTRTGTRSTARLAQQRAKLLLHQVTRSRSA